MSLRVSVDPTEASEGRGHSGPRPRFGAPCPPAHAPIVYPVRRQSPGPRQQPPALLRVKDDFDRGPAALPDCVR